MTPNLTIFNFERWKSSFSSGHRVYLENLWQVQSKQSIIYHIFAGKKATGYKKNMRQKNLDGLNVTSLKNEKFNNFLLRGLCFYKVNFRICNPRYLINFNKSTPSWITVKRNAKNQFVPALNSICEYFQHIVTNVDLKFEHVLFLTMNNNSPWFRVQSSFGKLMTSSIETVHHLSHISREQCHWMQLKQAMKELDGLNVSGLKKMKFSIKDF